MALRIPEALESAIISYRNRVREERRAMIERSNGQLRMKAVPEEFSRERTFWDIEDDAVLEDFLYEDVLDLVLLGGFDAAVLPKGYAPLINVLEFERHCQFEGWHAVSNRSDVMPLIIQSYRFVVLADEANALTKVFEAFQTVDEESEHFHEVLTAAYGSVPNTTPEIEDRLPLILNFVRSHPEVFATVGA
jgi:hypothetical protein